MESSGIGAVSKLKLGGPSGTAGDSCGSDG
jgi:hypothetical protein